MLRVATVCSGIGAPEKALEMLGIPFELVCFSEINEAAIKSYCAMHGVERNKNFGDLTKVNKKVVPFGIDLLVGGTPCQNFSVSGRGEGGDEGSGTRSSLMWNYLQLIALAKPRIVIWENVPGAITKKHIHNFRKFYYMLVCYGYGVHAKVVNAKFFNVPQNRERLFVVAIRKEDDNSFEFPVGYDSGIRLKHILQDEIPTRLATKNLENMVLYKPYLGNNTHRIIRCGDLHWNKYRQNNIIMSIEGISECLMYSNDAATGAKIYDNRAPENAMVRRVTPFESFRLMGFEDCDYEKCRYKIIDGKRVDHVRESDLYMQAGNSIVVTVLAAIFGVLYGIGDWEDRVFKNRKKSPKDLLRELPLFAYLSERGEDAS